MTRMVKWFCILAGMIYCAQATATLIGDTISLTQFNSSYGALGSIDDLSSSGLYGSDSAVVSASGGAEFMLSDMGSMLLDITDSLITLTVVSVEGISNYCGIVICNKSYVHQLILTGLDFSDGAVLSALQLVSSLLSSVTFEFTADSITIWLSEGDRLTAGTTLFQIQYETALAVNSLQAVSAPAGFIIFLLACGGLIWRTRRAVSVQLAHP